MKDALNFRPHLSLQVLAILVLAWSARQTVLHASPAQATGGKKTVQRVPFDFQGHRFEFTFIDGKIQYVRQDGTQPLAVKDGQVQAIPRLGQTPAMAASAQKAIDAYQASPLAKQSGNMPPPPSGGTVANPCALLSQSELSQVVGGRFGPGTRTGPHQLTCHWQDETFKRSVSVSFLDSSAFGHGTNIPGIADEAHFVNTGSVVVWEQNARVRLTVRSGQTFFALELAGNALTSDEARKQTLELGRQAVSHLQGDAASPASNSQQPEYGVVTFSDLDRLPPREKMEFVVLHYEPQLLENATQMYRFIQLNNPTWNRVDLERHASNEFERPKLLAFYKDRAQAILQNVPRSLVLTRGDVINSMVTELKEYDAAKGAFPFASALPLDVIKFKPGGFGGAELILNKFMVLTQLPMAESDAKAFVAHNIASQSHGRINRPKIQIEISATFWIVLQFMSLEGVIPSQ